MNDSSQISRLGYRLLVGGWSRASQSTSLVVLTAGVLALVHDSRGYAGHAAFPEIHTLFGLLLLAAVFNRFQSNMKLSKAAKLQDIAGVARTLSREVYLLMYLLLGVKVIMGWSRSQPGPVEGFRDYLLCGLLTLLLIRILAVRWAKVAAVTSIAARSL